MGRTGIGLVCLCLWTVGVVVRGEDDVNVATGKTYSQSSRYPNQGPSSRAANGDTSGKYPANCIHTRDNGDLNPWWEVDLNRTYPVNNISIWARTGGGLDSGDTQDTQQQDHAEIENDAEYPDSEDSNEPIRKQRRRSDEEQDNNFQAVVKERLYPSTITVDGETCATVESFPDDTREKRVTCSAVMYGQTVRITRHGTSQEATADRILNLCELEVWVPSEVSQCPAGSYGTSCNSNCNDHCGGGPGKNFCYQSSGLCYDGCVDGWYGAQCSTACSPGCGNNQCDEQTGHCAPCSDGYTGDKCAGCVNGYYGDMCDTMCPTPNCRQCHQVTGECEQCTLNSHLLPPPCTECEGGYYKINTGTCGRCDSNCQSQSCDSQTGRCNGCVNGYYGDMCDTLCPTPNCQQCHQDTVVCEQCTLNSHLLPPPCTECEGGYYKSNTGTCDRCASNCQSQSCDSQTGRCNGCEDGYYGDTCDTLCQPNCQQCHQDTGECEQCALDSHLLLPDCTECENGYYQINISTFDRCSPNCRSLHCVSSPEKRDDKTTTVINGVLATLLVISVCIIIIFGVIQCFRVRMSRKTSRHGNAEHEAVTSTAATSPRTVTKAEREQEAAGFPGAGQQDDEQHYEKVDDLPSTRNVDPEPSALHDVKVQLPYANVANSYSHTPVHYQNTGDAHLYE